MLAAGHDADPDVPRTETAIPRTVAASQAKAAPSRRTAATRQTQTKKEGEAEGRTVTHARYMCTGPTCRQTYEPVARDQAVATLPAGTGAAAGSP